jgi:exosome complex RNA-binding protein Rrp4
LFASYISSFFSSLPSSPLLYTLSNHSLLSPSYTLLPTLASRFAFETAIGTNGELWLRATTLIQTIALGRVIAQVDEGRLEPDQAGEWIDQIEGIHAE